MNQTSPQVIYQEDERAYLHAEFCDILRAEVGMNEHFASPLAAAFLRGLCERMGGREVYIPSENRAERNAAIRNLFNGTNIDKVCQQFGVSRATVYRVVNGKP